MRNLRAVFCEAALVTVGGLLVALAANAISPRGLRLSRDYFPGARIPPASPAISTNSPAASGSVSSPLESDSALRRLAGRGLQSIASNDVVALFRDPRHDQGLIAFIDARADGPYQAGHIPGAWQFDHYRAETFLPAILPVCLTAQQVVIYCNGGSCEDSEFAAITLRDTGVPGARLFVYVGGIAEWKSAGLPVETGSRRSGQILNSKP